jgi:multiple antibiotic resistance protein
MIDYVSTFIFFFAVIDPIGTVPVFIAVTGQFDHKAKRLIAFKATLAAATVLIFFVVAGEIILTAMAIPLSAFQVAGGIVFLGKVNQTKKLNWQPMVTKLLFFL